MRKEINKQFILDFISKNQQDLGEIVDLLTQYIYERKGKIVSIDPQSCIFNMRLTQNACNHIISYYMIKFKIVKMMDKGGNVIGIF